MLSTVNYDSTIAAIDHKLYSLLDGLDMDVEDINQFEHLSAYLILDGHRTGIKDSDENPVRGYIEGAIFSLRFAKILKELGCKKVTFLIHTLRNYKTMDRMQAIFSAVENVGKEFISMAYKSDIRLKYFGENVHEDYSLAKLVNMAEAVTKDCSGFELNYITNYSEVWAMQNYDKIADIPEINVICRFTKGHYSGAGIPGHSNKANFMYVQQASVSENWSDDELYALAFSLLKSNISLNGFVGGKSYSAGEKEAIRNAREDEMWQGTYQLDNEVSKRVISFSPSGPIHITF